jgi:hypothetical protein
VHLRIFIGSLFVLLIGLLIGAPKILLALLPRASWPVIRTVTANIDRVMNTNSRDPRTIIDKIIRQYLSLFV